MAPEHRVRAHQRQMRAWLAGGGFSGRWAFELFNAARVLLAIALPLLLVPWARHAHAATIAAAVVVVAAAGFFAPAMVVEARR